MKKIREKRLLSAILAAIVTLFVSYITYKADVPNPLIITVVVMIFFTAMVNDAAGAMSGICIILYALFYLSENHSFIHFSRSGLYKCNVIVISLFLIYMVVNFIRRRQEHAYQTVLDLNAKLESQNEILQQESDHDPLTGLYNRRGGDKRIAEWIKKTEENSTAHPRALLATIDIDNFKDINDLYGHAAGDEALRVLSRDMEQSFPKNGIFMRYGGDEFQILLYGNDIFDFEQKVREFAHKVFYFTFRKREVTFHISCGYAFYPVQARTQQELSRKSDVALYSAKMNGKHQALLYSEDNDGSAQGTENFSMRSVTENLPIAFFVYRADETEKVLVVSNTFLDLCECSDFSEFQGYTGGTFRGVVYPEDRERVEKSIESQISVNRYGLDAVDYRILTKNGRIHQIHDLGRLVHDPEMGDLFYVIVYDKNILSAAEK